MKDKFIGLENCTYLNTAYCAPISKTLVEWRDKVNLEYASTPDYFKRVRSVQIEEYSREQLSWLLDAPKENIFLTAGLSAGFQTFLFKIPKTYKFLVLEDDYPSIIKNIDLHQLEYTKVDLKNDVEKTVLNALRKYTYDVFAFSIIQYNSGLLFDIDFLHTIKKEFPNLIILADGTQFIGAEPFSFKESAIDAVFGSGYKWLLAGHGNGYMCIKDELLTQLKITKDDVRLILDYGHKVPITIGALGVAIKELRLLGYDNLFEEKRKLSVFLFEELKKRNVLEDFVHRRKQHSSIFVLKISEDAYQALIDEKIHCVKRGVGVRVSLHFYNTLEDVNHLLTVIDKHI